MFSLSQVFNAVLISPPSHILDDVGLAVSETVLKDVIDRLDF